MKDRQQLEHPGEDAPAPGFGLVPGAQGALHDVLVGAPVPEADDRRAEEHSRPREVGVEVPRDPVRLQHRRPGPVHPLRNDRLPQVEEIGIEGLPESSPAPESRQPEPGQEPRAHHQHQRLQRLGVGDRAHSARDGVDPGEHDHDQGAHPEAVQEPRAELQLHVREQRREDHPAREDPHRDLGQHVAHQRDQREHPARGGRETALQELGHGVDARPHEERDEHPGEHEQAPRVQLVVRQGDPVGGARPREADQVLGADVRREDRGPDDEPPEVAVGQEVVVRRVLAPREDPGGESPHHPEVGGDDQPVEGRHAVSGSRGKYEPHGR